jgi:adenylylsulfate kinase-like enzyme
MKNKELTITISGPAASGKSRLAYYLRNLLIEKGFKIEQELNRDHPTKKNFDEVMCRNVDDVIELIKAETITLKELQTKRKI